MSAIGNIWNSVVQKLERMYFLYEVHTALYMLEPWEKKLFNTVLLAIIAMSTYTTYVFLPQYTRSVLTYFGYL